MGKRGANWVISLEGRWSRFCASFLAYQTLQRVLSAIMMRSIKLGVCVCTWWGVSRIFHGFPPFQLFFGKSLDLQAIGEFSTSE